MIIDPDTQKQYREIRLWKTACTNRGVSPERQEQIYNDNWRCDHICKFPDCGKEVPFDMLRYGTCCITHYNQYRRIAKGDYVLEDLKFVCHLDGMRFIRPDDVGDHLRKNYRYTDAQMREYYDTYCRESCAEGTCKHCGAATAFHGIHNGYAEFCPNTDCNVRWYNSNTDRLAKASAGITKSRESGDCVPTQLGYWTKQGLSEAEAIEALKARQTTNSVEAIMARNKCTRTEAVHIRKQITEKWSANTHTGQNWSNISQELFWGVWDNLHNELSAEDVFFATFDNGVRQDTQNLEYRLETISSWCKPDFYIKSLGIIVEFDGEWYHSKSGWGGSRNDEQRDKDIIAKHPGMKILRVRERDFRNDPKAEIAHITQQIHEYARLAN